MKTDKKENWKLVKETSRSMYYVSDMGNCKTVNKKSGETKLSAGMYNSKIGYVQFAGSYVHRHVAAAFIEKPRNCDFVDHLNSDRTDNRASNLRWSTRKQNNSTDHARKMKSQNHHSTKHEDQVIQATKGDEVRIFTNGKAAARELGCSHVLVYNAINKRGSGTRAKGWTLKWVNS